MNESPIWERLETDTDKSYEAFCIYRDMGSNRSIQKAWKKYQSGTETVSGFFRDWSVKHRWQERVSAYDTQKASERSKRKEAKRIQIENNVLKDYNAMRKLIDRRVELLEISGYKGEIYEIGGLLELMKKADDYARRAVGLPDKITEAKNEHTGKDGKPIETTATIIIKTGMDLDEL